MEKARILEELIKERWSSIRAFALHCDIPESTLYTILKNGVGRASMDNILRICKCLGITVEELDEMAKCAPNDEQIQTMKEPSYHDLKYLIARNGNKLSAEEKMNLIKMISEL